MGKIGQFRVDITDAAPQPREDEVVNQTTVTNVIFLLRFEEMMSHNVSYMWVVSAHRNKILLLALFLLDYSHCAAKLQIYTFYVCKVR